VTPIPLPDSTVGLALSLARGREDSGIPSELENEIVSLFDELRNRLFQHLQQGRPRHNLRGWLFRVAHNLALKRLSGNERQRDVVGLGMGHTEVHLDPTPNPEEQVAFGQRQSRLLAVLQVLSAQDQRCLRLRAEGLTYREIADVLGMSLGSISASLARSLARLGRVAGR
jgi:RNA polymerase sigma-70 factor (ECF subfamily)